MRSVKHDHRSLRSIRASIQSVLRSRLRAARHHPRSTDDISSQYYLVFCSVLFAVKRALWNRRVMNAKRLEELIARWGKHRLVLCLRRTREDFFLPAPTGCGKPLTPEALAALRRQFEPNVFYSRDLCAHYFTYMSRSTGAHFVLFDDAESLRQKRALAQEVGIRQFFLLYPEVADLLPALLGASDAKTPCP